MDGMFADIFFSSIFFSFFPTFLFLYIFFLFFLLKQRLNSVKSNLSMGTKRFTYNILQNLTMTSNRVSNVFLSSFNVSLTLFLKYVGREIRFLLLSSPVSFA